MNLKDYYREIDAVLATIESSFVLVVSLPTPNGGRAGVVSEVNRATAAKMIVEKSARLMTPPDEKRDAEPVAPAKEWTTSASTSKR